MSVGYVRPHTLGEALEARARHPDWTVVAGGTDLMVGAQDRPPPKGLIDIFGLRDLTGVDSTGDAIVVGAATPYAALLENDLLRTELPSLWSAMREIGARQIQARGTIGGNIVTSSPVGDTLPVLLALHAQIHVASKARKRRIPYEQLITGYRRTQLGPDELVTGIELARLPPGSHQYWRKVGTRRAQAISKVMVAGYARLAGGWIEMARLAFGAVADRPIRFPHIDALLSGKRPSAELALEVAAAVRRSVEPIDDVRSSAEYRRTVAGNLAARFVHSLTSSPIV